MSLVALLATASIEGCSPCLGVVDCVDSPRRSISGQIVTRSGLPVAGVDVQLIGSYADRRDSASGRTGSSGLFELELPGRSDLPLTDLALRVSPPDLPGYVASGLSCPIVKVRGDGCVLDPIVPAPGPNTLYFFRYRQALEKGISAVGISFVRSGGSALQGPGASPSFNTTTDGAGNALIFPATAHFSSLDPMIGDLVVKLPDPLGTSTIRNFAVYPEYRFGRVDVRVVPVGPSLAYASLFADSATGRPVAGVRVRFTRTGGIATDSASWTTESDATGRTILGLRPLASGSVTGNLNIQSNEFESTGATGIVLSTFDSDSIRVLARYRVGATGKLYQVPAGESRR